MKSRVVEENWNVDCDKVFVEIKMVFIISLMFGFVDFFCFFILEIDVSL